MNHHAESAMTFRGTILVLALCLSALAMPARGQSLRKFTTDGTTAPAIEPGAPAGSYALSGFDNVN